MRRHWIKSLLAWAAGMACCGVGQSFAAEECFTVTAATKCYISKAPVASLKSFEPENAWELKAPRRYTLLNLENAEVDGVTALSDKLDLDWYFVIAQGGQFEGALPPSGTVVFRYRRPLIIQLRMLSRLEDIESAGLRERIAGILSSWFSPQEVHVSVKAEKQARAILPRGNVLAPPRLYGLLPNPPGADYVLVFSSGEEPAGVLHMLHPTLRLPTPSTGGLVLPRVDALPHEVLSANGTLKFAAQKMRAEPGQSQPFPRQWKETSYTLLPEPAAKQYREGLAGMPGDILQQIAYLADNLPYDAWCLCVESLRDGLVPEEERELVAQLLLALTERLALPAEPVN